MSTAKAAPAPACAPKGGAPEPPPEPAKTTAKAADKTAVTPTAAQTSAQSPDSPIAVVSLLLGRRREPRHWLIAAHGDPAGLAARLQGSLAEYAAAASPGTSPFANSATSATAQSTPQAAPNTTANAPARAPSRAEAGAEVGAGQWASPNPAPGARSQTSSLARSTARSTASSQASSQAGASPRTESGPEHLLQRAFSDCTALERPDPPSEASDRDRLSLPSSRRASASLACWRRYAPGGAWQRRCGPMGLAHFLDHHGHQPDHLKSVHLY